ncbi:hypothetical protein HK105_208607 [Polyrhizophydium stewartii]|uniref:C2H2-type domain-containing protein n=1 Tax=Polyrhizophydium stewartii TaxID=2732419 RepID=A0ABR4MXA0_9FUNG
MQQATRLLLHLVLLLRYKWIIGTPTTQCGALFALTDALYAHIRQTRINHKSRGQQRIKCNWIGCSAEFSGHKEIDSHIKTHFPNHAVVCTTCRKSYKWIQTCETHLTKTGCSKTIALGAATLLRRPDMAAGLRIHDEPSNRTRIGTIAADLHDIAPMQADGAVEGDVAAGGANAAAVATGSAANTPAAPTIASKHKCKKGKAVQHGAASDKGSSEDVLASDTESSDQIRELLPKNSEETTTKPAAKKRKQSYKAHKKATKKPKVAQGDAEADATGDANEDAGKSGGRASFHALKLMLRARRYQWITAGS